jgi:hypothetical protein
MAIVAEAVPKAALDYDEILRRGGANCGDEDFALCKCPNCGRVYLVELEVDTLYLDPADLERRLSINIGVAGFDFHCEGCGGASRLGLLGSVQRLPRRCRLLGEIWWQVLGDGLLFGLERAPSQVMGSVRRSI